MFSMTWAARFYPYSAIRGAHIPPPGRKVFCLKRFEPENRNRFDPPRTKPTQALPSPSGVPRAPAGPISGSRPVDSKSLFLQKGRVI